MTVNEQMATDQERFEGFERDIRKVLAEKKLKFADADQEKAFVRLAAEKSMAGEPAFIPFDFKLREPPSLLFGSLG